MALPKIGEKAVKIELPEKLLELFEEFEYEFKPLAYKKHVYAAALLVYSELTDAERLNACKRVKADYFDQQNKVKQKHRIDAALKIFDSLPQDAQNAAIESALLSQKGDKPSATSDSDFADIINQIQTGKGQIVEEAKRRVAKKRKKSS